MTEYLIVTFHTTSEAMATERACRQRDIQGKLIPVPRTLSAGCGIAWRCSPEFEEALNIVFQTQDIEWEDMTTMMLP